MSAGPARARPAGLVAVGLVVTLLGLLLVPGVTPSAAGPAEWGSAAPGPRPAGATTAYPSTDVPKRIPPSGTAGTTTSTVTVSGIPASEVITDVDVTLDLTHTFDSDLRITLIAPDATSVLLVSERGDSGDNFSNTTFDDQAAMAISSGSPPFSGSYRPEQPLSTLNGGSPNGKWQLQIVDLFTDDSGASTVGRSRSPRLR